MEILNLKQGSPEWHAERLKCGTASEAPAMMGRSKYMKRDDLLALKKTGITKDVDQHMQRLYDKGHAAEAAARPIIEKLIGEDLYPVTGKTLIDGIPLLASYDGLTMMKDIVFEHKLWNEQLAEDVRNNDLDPHYTWQLDQQILVAGAKKAIFVVSDGTEENMEYMWYESKPHMADKIVPGWRQFFEDLEAHDGSAEEESFIAAEPVKDLPAVSVRVTGSIDVIDNFMVFEDALRDFIDNRLIREPQTDQDFVDLDAQIKALKKAESALEAAEAQMLSQVSTIDTLKRTKDLLHNLARDNRLMAERLLKAEKDKRRAEIMQRGRDAMDAHIDKLDGSLGGKIHMPNVPTDFAGVMKGKKTISSLNDAVDTELARAKIEANQVADKIRQNLEALREDAKGYESLFSDAQSLVMKENDDLKNLIAARITEHQKTEKEKEEQIKRQAEKEAERKVAQEQEKREAEMRAEEQQRIAEEQTKANPISPQQAASTPISVEPRKEDKPAELSPELVAWCNKYRVSKPGRAELLSILLSNFWRFDNDEKRKN